MKTSRITQKDLLEKAEKRLLEAINRTDMEKLNHLLLLIKMQETMSKATIIHKE